ncbi:MAG: hypothetical protein WAM28_05405 [Chlamydiales bacterium]
MAIYQSKQAVIRSQQDVALREKEAKDFPGISYQRFVDEALAVDAAANLSLLNRLTGHELLSVIQEVDRRLREEGTIGSNILDPLFQQDLTFLSHDQVQGLSQAFHRALLERHLLLPQLTSDEIYQLMSARKTKLEHCRNALSLIPQAKFEEMFNYFITRLGREHCLKERIIQAMAAYPTQMLLAHPHLRPFLEERHDLVVGLLNHLPQSDNQNTGGEGSTYSDFVSGLIRLANPAEEADQRAMARHPKFVAHRFILERGRGSYTEHIESIFDCMSLNDKREFVQTASEQLLAYMQDANHDQREVKNAFDALAIVLEQCPEAVPLQLLLLAEENIISKPERRKNLIQLLYVSKRANAKNSFVTRLAQKFAEQVNREARHNRGFFESESAARVRILQGRLANLPHIEPMFKAISSRPEMIAEWVNANQDDFFESTFISKTISQYMEEDEIAQLVRLVPERDHCLKMVWAVLRRCYQDQVFQNGAIRYLLNHPRLLWDSAFLREGEIPPYFLIKILEKGGAESREAIRGLNQEAYQQLLQALYINLDSPSKAEARFALDFLRHSAAYPIREGLAHIDWAQFESALARQSIYS